jgi:hypothetical protein
VRETQKENDQNMEKEREVGGNKEGERPVGKKSIAKPTTPSIMLFDTPHGASTEASTKTTTTAERKRGII